MDVVRELLRSLDGFESKHFQTILGLKDKESGKRIHLPKGLYAQREYGNIVIGHARQKKEKIFPVAPENEFLIFGNSIIRTRIVKKFDLKKRTPTCEAFDLDKVKLPLFIRNKRSGDYVETKVGKKKMKKIYHECRIPLRKRSELLMLCDQKGILWMLGVIRAYRGFISKKTKKILVVEFETTN
jgi:tRNA(Ile)-lysidine synthase